MIRADTSGSAADILVLGVGNVLWADEGFGVRCVEAFAEAYDPPPGVEAMDGGTQGLALVNALAEARRILIFDAVDLGLAPAELVVARGADVPRFAAGNKVSLHQSSMMEVLALAEVLRGGPPAAITLIGCQPVELDDYGGGLTPQVARQLPSAVSLAFAELLSWGVALAPARAATPVMPGAIARGVYEGGRPSAAEACRIGDGRVVARATLRDGG